MASTAGLVPITRHFLAKYYDKYPYTPINGDISPIISSLKEQYGRMNMESQNTAGYKELVEDMEISAPHKIDENLWKNREQVEETLDLFDKANWPASLKAENAPANVGETLNRLEEVLKGLLKDIEKFQGTNSDRVYNMVLTYMPQDFRCSIIKQQRERSEKRRQAEVEALVNAGGSIHDKFVLLWKQQMERRKQLAQLGSASGVYKQLVKFLVGVPLVLLEFVRQINDHQGPMEEQRERYGPPLYQITILSNSIRIFVTLWWLTFDNKDVSTNEMLALLEKSVDAYVTDLKHYLKFMGEVFENSPFLISAEDAGLTEEKADEFEETPIPPGRFHEVVVKVECEGSIVAWDFRLTSGKDVGFSVDFIDESGMRMAMLPYRRYEANQPNQGDFPSPFVGQYKLIWDNSYSTFSRKIVRHKLDIIPPVVPQSLESLVVEEGQEV